MEFPMFLWPGPQDPNPLNLYDKVKLRDRFETSFATFVSDAEWHQYSVRRNHGDPKRAVLKNESPAQYGPLLSRLELKCGK